MIDLPTFNDPAPSALLEYFEGDVHTGRGTGHIIAITDTVVPALAQHPLIAPLVAARQVCYFDGARNGERGTDLMLGTPSADGAVFDSVAGMWAGRPENIRMVGKYTSIMTEHGKAQGNRRDDFITFSTKARAQHGPKVVLFGVCVVNASETYHSHTNRGQAINAHRNGRAKAARALDILREVPLQAPASGLDALYTPVVITNNHLDPAERQVAWLRDYPQPGDSQPLSLAWFVDRIAQAYVSRYP